MESIVLFYWLGVIPVATLLVAIAAHDVARLAHPSGMYRKLTITAFVQTVLSHVALLLAGLAMVESSYLSTTGWIAVGLLVVVLFISRRGARRADEGQYGKRRVTQMAIGQTVLVLCTAVLVVFLPLLATVL